MTWDRLAKLAKILQFGRPRTSDRLESGFAKCQHATSSKWVILMSDSSVIAIMAAVGILLTGTVTADAKAFASAIQQPDRNGLIEFARSNPDSQFAPDALLLAAVDKVGRQQDKGVSEANGNLTCQLWIDRIDAKTAKVRWSIKGAVSASIIPLGIEGAVPATGEETVQFDSRVRIYMTARDANGNETSCWVSLGSPALEEDSLVDKIVVSV